MSYSARLYASVPRSGWTGEKGRMDCGGKKWETGRPSSRGGFEESSGKVPTRFETAGGKIKAGGTVLRPRSRSCGRRHESHIISVIWRMSHITSRATTSKKSAPSHPTKPLSNKRTAGPESKMQHHFASPKTDTTNNPIPSTYPC